MTITSRNERHRNRAMILLEQAANCRSIAQRERSAILASQLIEEATMLSSRANELLALELAR